MKEHDVTDCYMSMKLLTSVLALWRHTMFRPSFVLSKFNSCTSPYPCFLRLKNL